ncbi:hypothetical protein OOT00_02180 [Desulfobotulus sp. H1]|uniref:STAS domain-containing protein n=1 Tax=Desulfobotulus pelophilus TaxID=2823377 RepID=A0ABT3N6L0_9BACT|nr:hypothetical protein [Desulfobotulus pelophilus]MCW7752791.1 hypothetical protein [Desulfobotulus pelophilus]
MIPGVHLTPIGSARFLLEPGPGMDPSEPGNLIPEIIQILQRHKARFLFYDLAGTPVIDTLYYDWLCQLSRSCAAAAISMTVIRMPPSAACSLASHILAPPPFACALDTESPHGGRKSLT